MDRVPVEVATKILSSSAKADIKQLRLTCKSFAALGEQYLFADWELHLWPRERSLQILEAVSKHPRVPRYLQKLVCHTGILSEIDEFRVWKAAIVQEKFNAYAREHGTPSGGRDPDEFIAFHNDLDAKFSPGMECSYLEYRWYLDYEAMAITQMAQQRRLIQAMSNVRPKMQYNISMEETNVSLNELEHFHNNKHLFDLNKNAFGSEYDKSSLVHFRRGACLIHFLQYLHGISEAAANPLSQTELGIELDGLPMELLELYREQVPMRLPRRFSRWDQSLPDKAWSNVLAGATSVHIQFRSFPYSDSLSRTHHEPFNRRTSLGEIRSAYRTDIIQLAYRLKQGIEGPRLRKLELSFDDGICIDFTNSIGDNINHGRAMDMLSWTTLSELSIDRFTTTIEALEYILHRQPGIHRLTLKNGRLEQRSSLVEVVQLLRDKGDLAYICIEGCWESDLDMGKWNIFNEENFWDGNAFDGPFPKEGLKWQVEQFILHGGTCPLQRIQEDPNAWGSWDLLSDESWQYERYHYRDM